MLTDKFGYLHANRLDLINCAPDNMDNIMYCNKPLPKNCI